MPYFTIETVVGVAARYLAEAGRAPNAANASARLVEEAERVGFPAEPTEFRPAITFDIFLSHSSFDQLHVLGIYRLLIQRGYKVYLDQVCDPNLDRTHVTPLTANNSVSDRAEQIIVPGSLSNVSQSKWVPWELGFSDGSNGRPPGYDPSSQRDFV